ncbi:AraC family transcriptional regulator N-terminal domain-containing protein [Paraburkholderia sp.]|uniref:AraC family transcriptional regulator n=1 Tax=Paraburkholderia sp. TaxID=1926495 RepID=UPI003D701F4D
MRIDDFLSDIAQPPRPADGADELEAMQAKLVALLDRLTGPFLEGTMQTPIPGVWIHRIAHPGPPNYHLQVPLFAVIAQGSKRMLVGDEAYEYDRFNYFVSTVELPVAGQVIVADPAEPYLGMRLDIDMDAVRELIREEMVRPTDSSDAPVALSVTRLSENILDPVLRLLRLLETPQDIPVLAPMIQREILYRLLANGQGARLRQIALQDTHTQRIARAIETMRRDFAQSLRMNDLARDVHMSVSSFHQHFKAVTTMSPLQYQKQLRLHEARRIIFERDTDVALTARLVGYESASQFTREYGRLFGAPPLRDRRRWLTEQVEVD